MTIPTTKSARHSLGKAFNLPNQLTSLRLLLSVALFWLITSEHYITAFILFLVAVGTDWLDGYYARKFNQITTLGRILDPFADKVIVCGTFVFLVTTPGMLADPLLLRAWMVVVIVGRELLVTALRSFLEERGSDFSANLSGKLKMVLQCFAAGSALIYLHYPRILVDQVVRSTAPQWIYWCTVVSIWSAVVLTVYSGAVYVWIAYKLLKQKTDAPDA